MSISPKTLMPADNGAVPFVTTEHIFRAREKYAISERIALLERYRDIVLRLKQRGARVSPQAVSELIDDVFNTFSGWTLIHDPWFVDTFKRRPDAHTIRKLLCCDLDLEVQKLQAGSVRVIDVFLQIITHDPPKYLVKYLRE
jgi:hypothetical protein